MNKLNIYSFANESEEVDSGEEDTLADQTSPDSELEKQDSSEPQIPKSE